MKIWTFTVAFFKSTIDSILHVVPWSGGNFGPVSWPLVLKSSTYKATPSAIEKCPYKRGGLYWEVLVFDYLGPSEIWPDNMGDLFGGMSLRGTIVHIKC